MLTNPCCSCPIATDDFNRADGAPGANWTKLSGTDAAISGNLLDFSAAADYHHAMAYPGAATDPRHARARVKFSVAGGAQVKVGSTDGSNYFASTLVYVSPGCSILQASINGFGGCAPGPSIVPCVQVPLTLAEWHTLEVCLTPGTYPDPDKVVAKVTLPSGEIYSCTLLVDGPAVGAYAGLRTSAAAQFDDFYHGYMEGTGCQKACTNCQTPCLISRDPFTASQPCKWDVLFGSYTVSGGRMEITADGTKVQHHIFHPGLAPTHIVSGRLSPAGVIHRVYSSSGYFEFEADELRLYDNTATLVDSATDDLAELVPDADGLLRFEICYSDIGVLTATIRDEFGNQICASSPVDEEPAGYWVSLGGDDGAIFDDFEFAKHRSDEDGDCGECDCPVPCEACADDEGPDVFKLFDGVSSYLATPYTPTTCTWTAPAGTFSTWIIELLDPTELAYGGGASPGTYRIRITFSNVVDRCVYEKDFGTAKLPCLTLADEPIPLIYTDGSTCADPVFLTSL